MLLLEFLNVLLSDLWAEPGPLVHLFKDHDILAAECHASELNNIPLTSIACLSSRPACIFRKDNGILLTIARILFLIPYPLAFLFSILALISVLFSKMTQRYVSCFEFFMFWPSTLSEGHSLFWLPMWILLHFFETAITSPAPWMYLWSLIMSDLSEHV